MFTSLLLMLLRSGLKLAGGALVSHAVTVVQGLPVVHDVTTAVTGVVLAAAGVGASLLHTVNAAKASGKLVVESGPIYKFNN